MARPYEGAALMLRGWHHDGRLVRTSLGQIVFMHPYP